MRTQKKVQESVGSRWNVDSEKTLLLLGFIHFFSFMFSTYGTDVFMEHKYVNVYQIIQSKPLHSTQREDGLREEREGVILTVLADGVWSACSKDSKQSIVFLANSFSMDIRLKVYPVKSL